MSARPAPSWKSIARNIRALTFAVLVATLLVTTYTFVDAIGAEHAAGGAILAPPDAQALFALIYSSVVAVFLAAVCVPVWYLLRRARLDGWYMAAALGFVAVACWTLYDAEAGPILELAPRDFVHGLCGAAAGLATWWARPRS